MTNPEDADALRSCINSAAVVIHGLMIDGTLEVHQYDALLRVLGVTDEYAKGAWEIFNHDIAKGTIR